MEEMKAGRELDALVIKALGFKKNQSSFEQYEPSTWDLNGKYWGRSEFCPSTDIAAAWEVVDKIKQAEKYIFHLDYYNGEWTCGFEELNSDMLVGEAEGETAPLAICMAALKAVGR